MTGRPDNLPPEWLAAYADGELTPRERAWVEQWLADQADARDLLDAQESLAPGNTEFWAAVRPPQPSARQWAETLAGVRAPAPRPQRRNWAGWLGTVGLMATAATLLLALPAAERPAADPPVALPELLPPPAADDEPYVMAQPDDVRILSLPEEAARCLVVGHHPMGDTVLILAGKGEVALLGIGPDLAGGFPDEDAPMLWAPSPREP